MNMTIAGLELMDGVWHNLTLFSQYRGLRVIVDGNRVGDELDSAGVHDFLDPYLTILRLGGSQPDPIPGRDIRVTGI